MNIATAIKDKANRRGKHRILFYKKASLNQWNGITWNELHQKTQSIAVAMATLGVEEHDNIGIIAQNMAESIMVDFAAYANRAVVIPMFATLSSSQISYILQDSKIKLLFVGEQPQYDAVLEAIKETNNIEKVVVIDDSVDLKGCSIAMRFSDLFRIAEENSDKEKIVKQRQKNASKEDLANILYTSGTTGNSKGVMISHENISEAMRIHKIRIPTRKGAKSIAFLPMSHIFERLWTYYCLYSDVKTYLNIQPTEIQQTIKEVRPHYMCAVPRFWEKVFIGVKQKIDDFKPFKKAIVAWAIAVGEEYNINHIRINKKPSLSLYLRYNIANTLIFSKLKKAIGIENSIIFPTAGATMADIQAKFFVSIGIPVKYGYGLTETCATVCCYPDRNYVIGSVGALMPDIEVRIGDDNEIQVKGKTITKGYYNRPKETEEAFIDGWFRTGDMGRKDGDTIFMTDRLKDLFKTSNGKYISPQTIEISLTSDPYIEQVAVIGNNRNYVTAIISPSMPLLKEFAQNNSIECERIEDVLEHPQIIKMFEERISDLQRNFANFEKIKRFRLIKHNFSIESGELTSTLKLKRAVIQHNYSSLIEEMYEN